MSARASLLRSLLGGLLLAGLAAGCQGARLVEGPPPTDWVYVPTAVSGGEDATAASLDNPLPPPGVNPAAGASLDEAMRDAARGDAEPEVDLGALRDPDEDVFFGPGDPDGASDVKPTGLGPDGPIDTPRARGATAQLRPGVYQGDPRFDKIAAGWPRQVDRAMRQLAARAALTYPRGPMPVVELTPLRNERLAFRIDTDVVDGNRRALVRINAEPLVAGLREPSSVLVHALAAGVFTLTGHRYGQVPPWVAALAGSLATTTLDAQVAEVHHRLRSRGSFQVLIDAQDPAAAETTAVAVRCLVEDRELTAQLPRLLSFTAEGDEAEPLLTRLLREPDLSWVGPAREALSRRFETYDPQPWVLLVRAQTAYTSMGRGALDSMVPEDPPEEVRGMLRLLQARAAIAEGDFAGARGLLENLSAAELRSLPEPAEAIALHVEVEEGRGGDPEQARLWASRLDHDFPASDAREALRRRRPHLGFDEDPLAWLAMMRRRIANHGTEHFSYDTLRRVLRVAIMDHRPGYAREVLAKIGDRARAPEIAGAVSLLDDVERDPTPAARATLGTRTQRWIRGDRKATQDVIDGGRLSFYELQGQLPVTPGRARSRIVRMMVRLASVEEAAATVASGWAARPDLAPGDLDALAAEADFEPLGKALDGLVPQFVTKRQRDLAWRRLTYALDPLWLERRPALLRRMRHDDPVVRLGALRTILREAQPTPEAIGALSRDPAPMVRAAAVEAAGRERFVSLTAEGLVDDDATVREAAVLAMAKAEPLGSVELLMESMRKDGSPRVRLASGRALVSIAPRSREVLDALIATQRDPSAAVHDPMVDVLGELPKGPLAYALARATQVEAERATVQAPIVARYVRIFQRATGQSLGFETGLEREGVQRIARSMLTWAREREASLRRERELRGEPGR